MYYFSGNQASRTDMDISTSGYVGIALMIVGTIGLLPGIGPDPALFAQLLLLPAAAAVTYGTYLVGTDGDGRPV